MKKSVAIIDCAVKDPAYACFNRLQRHSETLLSYHNFPLQLTKTLDLEEGISGVIILGSHSNVGDGSTWHQPLVDFTNSQLEKRIPVFAICFGHQLMAHAFGSSINRNPEEKTLEGLRTINLKKEIFGFSKSLRFFTAHNYQIDKLSEELEVIGSSHDSQYEMLKHKNLPYWSCQSHPEGSDFFLQNEISFELSKKEREEGLKDGLAFLLSFISEV